MCCSYKRYGHSNPCRKRRPASNRDTPNDPLLYPISNTYCHGYLNWDPDSLPNSIINPNAHRYSVKDGYGWSLTDPISDSNSHQDSIAHQHVECKPDRNSHSNQNTYNHSDPDDWPNSDSNAYKHSIANSIGHQDSISNSNRPRGRNSYKPRSF